ncbi:uncharacterized protein Z518_10352 [Rhinocladiella mackenziei CBS 650.93]|uniref:Rhinocladiella mackenziei CBS 650.93 unplaced genomic scaffold supercont1.9, whole genome shotgun sequence n=1 Tax=Rhinocladiella mackenziei CBS 650.93 TaxID=1442369 RepID=A0A0D2I356_9EURO|nr:uncharacterized protein Z518_10352 [Rhinocladiella mackenziei CBS 650.93]KIX00214.1 hypothetical protein Z518_10352 [Rhinocladiella mackenziei CBS 650.93]
MSFKDMFPSTDSDTTGVMWYHSIQTALIQCSSNGSSQYHDKPYGLTNSVDMLVNSQVVHRLTIGPGLTASHFPDSVQAGSQSIRLKRNGNIDVSASGGLCVSSSCLDATYNMSYQVVPMTRIVPQTTIILMERSRCTTVPPLGEKFPALMDSHPSDDPNPVAMWKDSHADFAWSDAISYWRLIWNSLINLHNQYNTLYGGLTSSFDQVSDDVDTIVDTFAPNSDNGLQISAMDIFSDIYSLFGSMSWTSREWYGVSYSKSPGAEFGRGASLLNNGHKNGWSPADYNSPATLHDVGEDGIGTTGLANNSIGVFDEARQSVSCGYKYARD